MLLSRSLGENDWHTKRRFDLDMKQPTHWIEEKADVKRQTDSHRRPWSILCTHYIYISTGVFRPAERGYFSTCTIDSATKNSHHCPKSKTSTQLKALCRGSRRGCPCACSIQSWESASRHAGPAAERAQAVAAAARRG